MSPFTPETLAKAQATRKLRAAERKQAAIDKRDGVERVLQRVLEVMPPKILEPIETPLESWWNVAPVNECITALAKFKREYDKAAAIVLARSASTIPTHTCWTQLHKDTVPHSVQKLCKKTMEDGKQAFRDDGVFKVVDGIRIPDPVFCCNFACYETYQRSKQFSALSRH